MCYVSSVPIVQALDSGNQRVSRFAWKSWISRHVIVAENTWSEKIRRVWISLNRLMLNRERVSARSIDSWRRIVACSGKRSHSRASTTRLCISNAKPYNSATRKSFRRAPTSCLIASMNNVYRELEFLTHSRNINFVIRKYFVSKI